MDKDILLNKLINIKNAVLKTVPALKIYLFGSYAYGKPGKESDMDIYVVIPDDFNQNITYMTENAICNINDDELPSLDLFFVKESKYLEYLTYSDFEKTIIKKGIMLYGN